MEPTTITLVPHTHWDREWYEPFSVFSELLVTMMDELIELGEAGFPHFHLDGQTAMIDDYLARRPEQASAIRDLARAGRLSVGPWVAQMDEFLASGESHIRNLEMGLARAREIAGDEALDVGYMPDQFGHIGQMPQILRMGGLHHAMVWRGVPKEITSSVFRWRAPDGSEILAEYMVFGYFNGESFEQAADPAALAEAVSQSVESMRPFMAGDRVVIMEPGPGRIRRQVAVPLPRPRRRNEARFLDLKEDILLEFAAPTPTYPARETGSVPASHRPELATARWEKP